MKIGGIVLIVLILISLFVYGIFFVVDRNENNMIKEDFEVSTFILSEVPNETVSSDQNSVGDFVKDDDFTGVGGGGEDDSYSGEDNSQSNSFKCHDEQISYSMGSFYENFECNLFDEGVCIDKTINCSVAVKNLDPNVVGIFGVEMRFQQKFDRVDDYFDSLNSTFSLGPGEMWTLKGLSNVRSSGEEGIANKNLGCKYIMLQVPRKEVCV